jgi:transcriptional regulator with XRE-family HTH domain
MAKKNPSAPTAETRRRDFGRAVQEARAEREWSQEYLGNQVGASQAAVAAWEKAVNVPDPETVFRLERTLGLRAGELSIHLGFLPLNARDVKIPKADVVESILRDPRLGDVERRALLAAYRSLAKGD